MLAYGSHENFHKIPHIRVVAGASSSVGKVEIEGGEKKKRAEGIGRVGIREREPPCRHRTRVDPIEIEGAEYRTATL